MENLEAHPGQVPLSSSSLQLLGMRQGETEEMVPHAPRPNLSKPGKRQGSRRGDSTNFSISVCKKAKSKGSKFLQRKEAVDEFATDSGAEVKELAREHP